MNNLRKLGIRLCQVVLVMALIGVHGVQGQDVIPSSVDIRMVQGGSGDELMIQLLPHSSDGFGGILSALTVTVRYDSTSTLTLGATSSFCTAWSPFPSSPVVFNDGMAYVTFNGFGMNRIGDPENEGGCNTLLPPGTWFTVATVSLVGEGCTEFILGNDAFIDSQNRSYYIAMNGWEVTGEVEDEAVTAGDCTEVDCMGMEDGPAQPGTPCDDGDPETENDTWTMDCECVGTIPCVPATITELSSNSPLCANGTLTLHVAAAGDGLIAVEWTGTGSFTPDHHSADVSVTGAVSGTYTVVVTNECGTDSGELSVTVEPPLSGSIDYPDGPYCGDAGTVEPMITGTTGGQFSATPTGLALDPSTGEVHPSLSTPGTYAVEYVVQGSAECPGYTATTEVTITAVPAATIQYPSICGSGMLPVGLIGTGGGLFSATPAGLVLNATSGEIDLGTSAEGTYTVTYTIPATGTCDGFSTSTSVTVLHAPWALINYEGSPYCVDGGLVPVTHTGSGGGTYTASSGGLALDAGSGEIDLDASDVGIYVVTYTIPGNGPCPGFSTTATVTVGTSPFATISYAQAPYCVGGGVAAITRTGSSGGSYSASPPSLAINGNTGLIQLDGSMPGTYTVTYTIPASGACGEFSTSTQVEILPPLTASIMYGESPYCTNSGVATVSFTGDGGGLFSADPAGLALDPNSGAIDLGASMPGTYTVTYDVQNSATCSFSTSTQVIVVDVPWAAISYADGPYCTTGGVVAVTHNGTLGGTYTASPEGLALNADQGSIVLQSSTPGSYTVTYTMPGVGPCPGSSTTTEVVVQAAPTATIDYPDGPLFCAGDGLALVSFTGDDGGTFSAEPDGLTLDPVSGTIDLGASTPGTYTVTYGLAGTGACEDLAATAEVIIQETPWAAIGYPDAPYCTNGGTATVSRSGAPGGTYSASPAGLAINEASGLILLGSSTPGSYTVTYTIPAFGPCPAFSTTAEVLIQPAPTAMILYEGSPYCSNDGQAAVSFSGTTGGTYTASPGGLSINASTGMINLYASAAGSYTVTYTIAANGGCAAVSATAGLQITEGPVGAIGYNDDPYCTGDGLATVVQVGTPGGTYSATPAGLSIDPATGAIDLSASTGGTYVVTYTIAAQGGCPELSNSATFILITVGEPCDDGDPATVDDMIQEDCSCAGDIIDGIDTPAMTAPGLLLYPNPTRSGRVTLHAEGLGAQATDVRMMDALGRQVHQWHGAAPGGVLRVELDLPSGLAPGIYLVQVAADDQRLVGRLVIE